MKTRSARPAALLALLLVPAMGLAQLSTEPGGGGSPPDPYSALTAYAATREGAVGWAVRDAKGRLHQHNGNLQVRCASIIKLAILSALLQKATDENRSLTAPERRLAYAMITASDNNSATALWNELGRDYILGFLRTLGLRRTVPDPQQPYSWGYTLTTANDMSLLISRLYNKKFATPGLCNYGIYLLTKIVPADAWGLKDGVPAGTWVAYKNGWYPETTVWRVNSVGAIHAKTKDPYFMAVLTRYPVGEGEGYGIQTIGQLSRLAYRLQPRKRPVPPTNG